MEIHLETEADYSEVENLTREAFWDVYRPGCNEHLCLHNLRKSKSFIPELDYVVIEDEKIVGNIAYSKMYNEDRTKMYEEIISFGPISVHPDYHKMGIGSMMIKNTLEKAKELGYKVVMITGNDKYYHRFGFQSASNFGVHLPGMNPEEEAVFFMAIELEPGYLKEHAGIYDFDSAFAPLDEELEEFEKQFPSKKKREAKKGDLL